MNFRQIFSAGLAAIIFLVSPTSFAAQSATDKLIKIEQDTYGEEQVGAILNRISQLEKDYNGKNMQGNMNARIEEIYNSLYENSGQPSIAAKVNALEWNVSHEVKGEGIKKRLVALETEIFGAEQKGSLSSRIGELSKATFGDENIPMIKAQLPTNSVIKVELMDSINSKTLQVGDVVTIKVAEDFLDGDKLIFAKGLQGEGKVKSVRKAKGWTGRNGKVDIEFEFIRSIDGNNIETFVGEEAKQKMIAEQMTEGASLVAMDINDDWQKVLVRGKNVDINAGTQLYIQTKNSVSVYALNTNAKPTLKPQANSPKISEPVEEVKVTEKETATVESVKKVESVEPIEEDESAITYLEDE